MKRLIVIVFCCFIPCVCAALARDADTLRNAKKDAPAKKEDAGQENTSSVKRKVDLKGRTGYTDLASYLPGRVAGVTISGAGGERIVLIRGVSTFYGKMGALIIVDGIEYDSFESANSSVNIQDIESVEVIMDGAEYGVKGSNGVVVITTRTGRSEEKKECGADNKN